MTTGPLASARLHLLQERYGCIGDRPAGEQFYDSFQRYVRANRESLFDLTLTAVSARILLDQDSSDIDPRLLDALEVTNPSLSDHDFTNLTAEQLQGAINSAKGKYFEFLVVDRLNAGEQVGPILLPDGYQAVLAHSFNQPGWDMQVVGPDGAAAEYFQLKASDTAGYIKEALVRYPDIQILATHEIGQTGLVLDSGINEDDLAEQVSSAIEVLDTTVTEQFFDYFSPLLPLITIAALEGYKLSLGKESLSKFKLAMARRGQRVVAANVAGAAVYAIGGGLVAIPATFAGGLLFDRYWNSREMLTSYRTDTSRLLSMRLAQQGRLLAGPLQ